MTANQCERVTKTQTASDLPWDPESWGVDTRGTFRGIQY